MADFTTPTPCDLADITAATDCGESLAGIASVVYVGFKGDLVNPPRLKQPGSGSSGFTLGDYSYIESTPGFTFKSGKGFKKWEIATDTGQFTLSSNGQKKGFVQTINFGFDSISPEIAAMLRTINNRKDVFFVLPEGEQYQVVYDPDRNVSIDSGGIAYDSGTTPDSDQGLTVSINLSTVSPKTYYDGTITVEPTP